MKKFGLLSLGMVLLNVLYFWIIRGPDANLTQAIIVLGSLSILGIIFALVSKNWIYGITGFLLNGVILVFAGLLVIAKGIGG